MKSLLPSVVLSAIVAAVVAFTLARPLPDPGTRAVEPGTALADPVALAPERGESDEIVELRMKLTLLEQRIDDLEGRGAAPSRVVPGSVEGAADARGLLEGLGSMEPAVKAALRDEITSVLAAVDEEKAAEARAAEIAKRVEQAEESYAEYDEVEENLGESMAKLTGTLGLDARRSGDLRGLVEIQNQRNREMTQLWSSGEVSDDELGTIFTANRTAHRAEVLALVGEEGLPAYRKFVQDGGFGGLFSYFTAPWEEWEVGK